MKELSRARAEAIRLRSRIRASYGGHVALHAWLAVVFLAFHLPYLPTSLEDLDSINFALGVRHFDVAQHQPHPPGYPLFIAAGKIAHAIIPSEAKALAMVSVLSGTLGVLAIGAFFRRIASDWSPVWVTVATALAVAAPLYWFTSARPLSDVTGLAAAVAVQAAIASARTRRELVMTSAIAGIAAGIRSQVVWLTVPLLVVRAAMWIAEDRHDRRHPTGTGRNVFAISAGYVAGALVWAIPLVVFSGGPVRYWNALFGQGAEDFTGVRMLGTTRNVRALIDAIYQAVVAPWAAWPVATVVLALAAAGAVALVRRNRNVAIAIAVAFGPYFLFNLVFQEIVTSRYALPAVVPTAFLATAGAKLIPKSIGLAVIVVTAIVSAHIGGRSIAAYSRATPPAFRLLDDMHRVAASIPQPPVLAMDRREELDFRRPIRWVGDAMPRFERRLPSPPQHEWLEVVKYWTGGGRAPVWFVADPLRADVDLIDHPAPFEYRWPLPYPVLIGGVRPNEMRWVAIESPDWYVGPGWALTPESAGVSDVDRRGIRFGPIDAWVSRDVLGGAMSIGGRNFEASEHVRVAVTLDGSELTSIDAAPGAFAEVVRVPFGTVDATRDYIPVSVTATPRGRVAIEQFQASRRRTVFAFAEGWHEPEYNPQTGLRWRWLSERGMVKIVPLLNRRAPDTVAESSATRGLVLHLEGESPLKYFSRPSLLVVRAHQQEHGSIAADSPLFSGALDADFAIDVKLPPFTDAVTLETDQFFSPVDRSRPWRRSSDRRHLGLRIFKFEIRAAS